MSSTKRSNTLFVTVTVVAVLNEHRCSREDPGTSQVFVTKVREAELRWFSHGLRRESGSTGTARLEEQ